MSDKTAPGRWEHHPRHRRVDLVVDGRVVACIEDRPDAYHWRVEGPPVVVGFHMSLYGAMREVRRELRQQAEGREP